jgi:hypothetical protein
VILRKEIQTANVQNSNSNAFQKEKFNDQFPSQKIDQGATITLPSHSKKSDNKRPSLKGMSQKKILAIYTKSEKKKNPRLLEEI